MYRKTAYLGLIVGALLVAAPASAATLTTAQTAAIIGLLRSFGASESIIANVQATLAPGSTNPQPAPPAQSSAPTLSTAVSGELTIPSVCTTATVGGTCAIAATWTTQNSVRVQSDGARTYVSNLVGRGSTGYVGSVNNLGDFASPTGVARFDLTRGIYTFTLYGYADNGATMVVVDTKTVTVNDPDLSANPQIANGTIDAASLQYQRLPGTAPTLSGTAVGVSSVYVTITGANGISVILKPATVTSGRWSSAFTGANINSAQALGLIGLQLPVGSYTVGVYGSSNYVDSNLLTPKATLRVQSGAPTGTLNAVPGCTGTTSDCMIVVAWTEQDSTRSGAPFTQVNLLDSAGGFYGGSPVDGVSYRQSTNSSATHTFAVPPGAYTVVLYGWYNNAFAVLGSKQVQVSTASQSTLKPTATVSAQGCSALSGTCDAIVSWRDLQNSYYGGAPYIVMNVIDAATNTFYQGSAIEGVSTHQAQTSSGSQTFALPRGTYTVSFYGWFNNTYAIIESKPLVVGAGSASAINAFFGGVGRSTAATPQYRTVLTHVLMRGAKSSDVTALQYFLIRKGYLKVPATGFFGAQTEAALKMYQKDSNIEQTGIAGSSTIQAISTQ